MLTTIVLLGAIVAYALGAYLCAPHQRPVGPLPSDLSGEAVTIPSASGSTLSGWYLPARANAPTVILLHGVRGNRLSMLSRARFLHQAGYSVLLFDFQAHGESSGQHITLGYLESKDAQAAVAFVRAKNPGSKIALLGTSLGGAAALLAHPPLSVDAMILELVYPTITQACEDRIILRLGSPGKYLAPLLTCQLRPRLGIGPEDLRPIDQVGRITIPKFFIAGAEDKNTTLAESQALFAAAAEPKQCWSVPGAGHIDLHPFVKTEYEKRVLEFLQKYLEK